MFPGYPLLERLALTRAGLMRGEIWRLVTFLVIPDALSPLYALISLYFYYFIGTTLESRWGARRFLLYYGLGAIGAILAGLISGVGINTYLNLSLFFAFAILYPDHQVLIFFMLPIKIKWLAVANALFFLWALINGGMVQRAAIIAAILHLLLFFGGDLYNLLRLEIGNWKRRQQFRRNSRR
ncbi:MAG TPA: hypothetical protein GX722_01765, partial [Clostridiales bacterium]|nr:hypothetical protein [Clostridiales bacterium]